MASSSTNETPPVSPLPGNCLVIGGNRGLGLEVVRHLKKRESTVLATTRTANADLEVIYRVGQDAWRGRLSPFFFFFWLSALEEKNFDGFYL